MALKQLKLRKRLEIKKKELEELRAVEGELTKREEELTKAADEAATEEDLDTIDTEGEELEKEQAENKEKIGQLEKEIADIENELEDLSDKNETQAEDTPEPEERKRVTTMNTRMNDDKYGLTRDDVKSFLGNVRTCIREKRAIENVGLTIPTVWLPLLRQIIEEKSKLYGYVTVRAVSGNARQVIMGEIPEGVWTDCCAALNELSLGFNDVDFGCWKVGGFFEICNATLEDSDYQLSSEILSALGISIAKAIDKAIIYGRGTRMPMGIVTSLNQTPEPSDYLPTSRAWTDLHETNVLKKSGTGLALFKGIVEATEPLVNRYFDNGLVWVMNERTHKRLLVEAMDKNLNAAIVSGIDGSMPVIGGTIIELPFIPNNNIVYGYFGAYNLVERAGQKFATSEHYKFLEDRTVFKGTARYDGKPVIREAFGVMTIDGTDPVLASAIDFPADLANQVENGGEENGG